MATWGVSPYHKKSCEEHEYYTKDGMSIVRKTGFRGASFIVETNDDNPPEFEFDFVPGGDGRQDSIDMYNCAINNIENVDLDSMWDGCWEDIIWDEDISDDERQRLEDMIEEHSIYDALENHEGWAQSETQAWIWGPILIEDNDGNRVRIIVADEDGNVIDFNE